ncbi:MAG: hypothetical protein ACXABG_03335 [Promethearchaeota archaeon]|jgi:hypothetical protein
MKRTKIILLVTLGICMLSFIPAVLGTANVRPISDFTDTNNHVAGYWSPESNLVIFPHGARWLGLETIADCDHSGSVLEKELKDGRILYKVNLHVKNALMWLYWAEPGWFANDPIFIGKMDYYFTVTMIVEGNLGGPVPTYFDVIFGVYGELSGSHITGSGTGYFTAYAGEIGQDFTPGDSAKVKLNQLSIAKPEGHPFYPEMWPAELTFFH